MASAAASNAIAELGVGVGRATASATGTASTAAETTASSTYSSSSSSSEAATTTAAETACAAWCRGCGSAVGESAAGLGSAGLSACLKSEDVGAACIAGSAGTEAAGSAHADTVAILGLNALAETAVNEEGLIGTTGIGGIAACDVGGIGVISEVAVLEQVQVLETVGSVLCILGVGSAAYSVMSAGCPSSNVTSRSGSTPSTSKSMVRMVTPAGIP